jgi:phage terminase Nu1 subunit (DNA packaging protein)
LATQRKEHVHVSVIGDLLAQFAGQASAIFQSAPSRIKNRLPHLKSREINIIEKELAGISNAIAEIRPHRD